MESAPSAADRPEEESGSDVPLPWYVKYPDMTEEEDMRSLLGLFQMLSPEERIQSTANIANLFGNAVRIDPPP